MILIQVINIIVIDIMLAVIIKLQTRMLNFKQLLVELLLLFRLEFIVVSIITTSEWGLSKGVWKLAKPG